MNIYIYVYIYICSFVKSGGKEMGQQTKVNRALYNSVNFIRITKRKIVGTKEVQYTSLFRTY